LPKEEWVFVSSSFTIDEIQEYWLEDVKIISQKDGKTKRKLFVGAIDDLIIVGKSV
jgi:hypothetical protein